MRTFNLVTLSLFAFSALLITANVSASKSKTSEASVTQKAKHVSISIDKPFNEVADFLAKPENFPKWAAGLASGLEFRDGKWHAKGPSGDVIIDFAAKNAFGVADHTVHLSSGEDVYVPLRAMANKGGTEVVLTLFKLPSMDDKQFAGDEKLIEKDLKALKSLLEK